MIGTIRKHSTWLWGIVITATIVTFVFWGNQSSWRDDGRNRERELGKIDGEPITREESIQAETEAELSFLFSNHHWPDASSKAAGWDVQNATYERLFWIHKLKQFDIRVDPDVVAQVAKEIMLQSGRGQPMPIDEFAEKVLQRRASTQDFERFVRHQLGIQQLRSLVGLGGDLILPQEAQVSYVYEHQQLATEAVFFSASNFLASMPEPDSQTVTQYFKQHEAEYRINDRRQVSYVRFDATNFVRQADERIAQDTNFNTKLDQEYQRRGTNYYKDAKSPQEAKQAIRDEVHHQIAMSLANEKAREFANTLFSIEPTRPQNLAALARTNGLPIHVSEPFDEENGPREFDGGPDFARAAFALTPEDPFAVEINGQAIFNTNSIFVIALDKKIPSEIPSLEKIHDRVVADFRLGAARAQAGLFGTAFVRAATNGLAQGKTFAMVCAEANVKPVPMPPVSIATNHVPQVEEHIPLNQFKSIAFNTPVGHVSDFQRTDDGGIVVYVERKLPIDEAVMRADLPAHMVQMRDRRKYEAFVLWLQREAAKSLRDTPLGRQNSGPPGAPPDAS